MRGWWRRRARDTDPAALVFVDESGANTAMARRYGRAPPGERVVGSVPHRGWKALTLLAALRLDGVAASFTVDAAADADVFRAFAVPPLVPALRPGDVVAWDRLPAHAKAAVEPDIRAAGAELRLLPPYSPDLSPIEPMWSKVKQALRTAAARTITALNDAAADAFAAVTADDARGWFEMCGYCVH